MMIVIRNICGEDFIYFEFLCMKDFNIRGVFFVICFFLMVDYKVI